MRKVALGQFGQPKRFGKLGQWHGEKVQTVNEPNIGSGHRHLYDFSTIHDQTRSNLVVVQVLQNEVRIIPFEVVGNAHRSVHAKQPIAKVLARVGPLKHPFVSFIILNRHEIGYVNTRFLHTLKIKEQKVRFLLSFFFLVGVVILLSFLFTFLFDGFHETSVSFGVVVLLTSRTSDFPALVFPLTSLRHIHHFTTLLAFRIQLTHGPPTRHSHALMVLETSRTLEHAVALSAYDPRSVLSLIGTRGVLTT